MGSKRLDTRSCFGRKPAGLDLQLRPSGQRRLKLSWVNMFVGIQIWSGDVLSSSTNHI